MTISIHMVRAVVEAVERGGGQRSELLAMAGLAAQRIDDCSQRVEPAEFERLTLSALALTGDPALGLHMGEHASVAAFHIVGPLSEHAATLRQGIQAVVRYARIFSDAVESALHEEGTTASVRFAFPRGDAAGPRLSAELGVAGLAAMIRRSVGTAVAPLAVFFAHDAPVYRAEYRRIFGGTERFGHAFTGIEFPRAWLDRTLLHNSAELYDALEPHAERALARLVRTSDLASRVRQQLASLEPSHKPTMDLVAQRMGTSARSLRRRLLDEGVSFHELVEGTLAEVAKRMLEAPRGSIQETAYAMGFAAPNAFHRAFKRWTGMTPREYMSSY